MKEIWKDIVGFEGLYQVSNLGRVKSLNYHKSGKERVLKNRLGQIKTIYPHVGLYKNGTMKECTVHRLVAEAFIANPENKEEVNHIDGNKCNNHISNLEWVTRSENAIHAIHIIKTSNNESQKKKVKNVETGEIFESQSAAGRAYGISQGTLGAVTRGERKTAGGYHWEFI